MYTFRNSKNLAVMKKENNKVKVSINSNGTGTYPTRIEFPDGKQERKEIGLSLFAHSLCNISPKLDAQFSDGNFDFHLSSRQYDKFSQNLIDFN